MLLQIRKPLKNHPLGVAKKYVETYSSSNAAAQDPEERVQLINIQYIHYKINSLIQNLQKKKKIERTRRLTDLEWPKSLAQNLHTPSTSHNNPRTSQSCRQNNNFRLIYSNVRNYSFASPSIPQQLTSNANMADHSLHLEQAAWKQGFEFLFWQCFPRKLLLCCQSGLF